MSVRGWVTVGKKFISENEEGAEMSMCYISGAVFHMGYP